MRLVSFYTPDGISFGIADGDKVVDLQDNPQATGILRDEKPRSVLDFLTLGEPAIDAAAETVARSLKAGDSDCYLDGLHLAAPIPRPGKLLALAGN